MVESRASKCFAGLICVVIVISGILANLHETVQADLINREGDYTSFDCSFRSVEDYLFEAEVITTTQWSGHSNLEIVFTNTGSETIHDWYFTFDFGYTIENPYNCYILEHEDNLYTISNNDWNQDILPGQSVTVGFTASSSDGGSIDTMPSFYLLNTTTVTLSEDDLSYSFDEYSDWTSGFSGALILANNTDNQIRDWNITFDSNRPITQVDAAALTSNSDGTYSISNDGITQNISAGQTYRIELQGGEHDSSIPFELTNYTVSAKQLALGLDDDNDNNGIPDVLEVDYSGTITVTPTATPSPTATDTPEPTVTPTATSTPVVTETPTPTVTPTPDISVTPTNTATPTPTAMPTEFPEDLDYYTDTDSDGLPDDIEDYYGTDKNNPDTDDDGVNDYYELLLSTDPLIPDSNGNSDSDLDGLSNALESELGTNPLVSDSDLDGLSDGEEYNLYGTDPTKYDTDDDGISDYNEIYLGSNPIIPDSDVRRFQTLEFVPSSDSELTGVTKVTVSGNISGAICENTKIRDVYGTDPHTSSIEALVGDPVNIESTGEFDSMTITFKYSDGLNEDNLRIMWYDEDNCEYVVLNNYTINKSGNTISVTTDHFSKYMLIDEEVWVNTWINAIGEAGSTSNMFIGGYLQSPSSYSQYMINRYGDNDSDGIADVLETNGMINNIGHVVYLNPETAYTDEDGLTDGIEMGVTGSLSEIFGRSPYTQYKNAWPVSAGSRWEDCAFYKCSSDALLTDTDSDGANDDEDATLNDENPPVNYILIGMDKPNSDALECMRDPYIHAFNERNETVIVLDIYNGSDYDYRIKEFVGMDLDLEELFMATFSYLQLDLSESTITNEKRFSKVEKMIIMAHGEYTNLAFAPDSNGDYVKVSASFIRNQINPACEIGLIDIHACRCGRIDHYHDDYMDDDTCVAVELVKKEQIEKVYAFTGTSFFSDSYSYCLFGKYVEYQYINGEVYWKDVETNEYLFLFFGFLPCYYPLEY